MQFCNACESILSAKGDEHNMIAYCKQCGSEEEMTSHVVSSRNYNEELTYQNPFQLRDMVHDSTYQRTINYECPNEQCKTHKGEEKMAIVFRDKDLSYQMICSVCFTLWKK